MSSHSLSVKLLEYGIGSKTAFLFDLSLSAEIPNGFYKSKTNWFIETNKPNRVGDQIIKSSAQLKGKWEIQEWKSISEGVFKLKLSDKTEVGILIAIQSLLK
jgi:hypothetical protein